MEEKVCQEIIEPEKGYYTIQEASQRLRCHRRTLGRWIQEGKIKASKVPGYRNMWDKGQWRIDPQELERVENGKQQQKRIEQERKELFYQGISWCCRQSIVAIPDGKSQILHCSRCQKVMATWN